MSTRSLRFALAAIAVSTLAACNESVAPLDLAGPGSSLAIAGGDGQVGAVGDSLPQLLSVIVKDDSGRAVPGYAVTWSTTAGKLSATGDTTGNDGLASVALTLPSTPDTVRVTAAIEGFPPVFFTASATPGGAPLVFRYVDAGSYHACGITVDEQEYCWGFNEDGQAGTGTISTVAAVTRVSSNLTARMSSGGRYHTCEVTLSGDLWCAGSNSTGQVTGQASSPVTAFTNMNWGISTTFRVVQAGLLHSCALSLSSQVWCWGANGEGQLGTNAVITPGAIEGPSLVGDAFTAVTTSGLHTCAITTDGAGECWGWGASGQLGNAGDTSSGLPVAVAGGNVFRTNPTVDRAPDPDFYIPGQAFISAGYAHTCGITTASAALCWGENEDGQLGNGGTADANAPVAVAGGLQFRAISAGYRHT
ncbi:MAG TPA: Ig-like domain-containing protein, partial [Gemmatimonadales bacterium]|nr:Ig-like domain-containing protein [Gemmatimonadales bacterium]